MSKEKTNLHFIPNTHLDREWTMDFQHSRKLTVNFLDNLLDIMDQVPGYKFLLDAQVVPLEDYLEIRPQNRDRLTAVIGVKDLIVVQAEGVTLVCPKDRAQDIKQMVVALREKGGCDELL